MVVLSRPNGHGPVTAACESRSPPRGSRRARRCDAIAFSPGRLADRTHYSFRRMVEMYSTLFPRMKQSPYFALSCPFTYCLGRARRRHSRRAACARACALPHLLGLLHRDVHVPVEAGEHAAVVDARVQLHLRGEGA